MAAAGASRRIYCTNLLPWAGPDRHATFAARQKDRGSEIMADGRLFIGNRRYSSWSLRGWLAVRLAGLHVEEVVIPFTPSEPTPAIAALSPNGLVPYLEHSGARAWESTAIIEYCAELRPELWPADRAARSHARSIAAEMHAGFQALRQSMWMNLGADFTGFGRTPDALADIARIERGWQETRELYGSDGPFLFGASFTGADIMFAPVVVRFLTWRPTLSDATMAYCAAVRAHPLVAAWYEAAAAEPAAWLLPRYETPDQA
jgi:glutathione S-transferase